MNHFRVIVRTAGSEMIRAISTETDYVTAAQLARGLTGCGSRCELVVNDRQWGEEAAKLAAAFGSTFCVFPGNAPAGAQDQGTCDGKNES